MPTSPREIVTPTGPKIGSIFAKMEILGISSFITQTGNQANDHHQWQEIMDIPVPVGTEAIVVSQDYWIFGFGGMNSLLDPLDDNSNPGWNSEDHNWGFGRASIGIRDINAPDFSASPATQSAKIVVRMNLNDENADDSWFGLLGYTLTFLGLTKPNVIVASRGAAEQERRINWH